MKTEKEIVEELEVAYKLLYTELKVQDRLLLLQKINTLIWILN